MLAFNLPNHRLVSNLVSAQSLCAPSPERVVDVISSVPRVVLEHYLENIYVLNDQLLIDGHTMPPSMLAMDLEQQFKRGEYALFPKVDIHHRAFKDNEKAKARKYCAEQIKRQPITIGVTDPCNASRTTHLGKLTEFDLAWEKASLGGSNVLVEDSQYGDSFELLIFNNRILAIYTRCPACVIGDGIHSVANLVAHLAHCRKSNGFYKRFATPLFDQHSREYCPNKGELIVLNHAYALDKGAMYVDLPESLFAGYDPVLSILRKGFGSIGFMHVTCFSQDIQAGCAHSSFRIRTIEYAQADMRHIFASHSCLQRFQREVDASCCLRNQGKVEFKPSPLWVNPFMRMTGQENILCEAAFRKGYNFDFIDSDTYRISNATTGQSMLLSSAVSDRTSAIIEQINRDKYLMKLLFMKAKVPTPSGFPVEIDQIEKAWQAIRGSGKKWVVKPRNGAGGSGVSTEVETLDDLHLAWQVCRDADKRELLVEEQVPGRNYRILIVGNTVCAFLEKIPAFVEGDGIHSIAELMLLKKRQRLQEANPHILSKEFALTPGKLAYLEKQGWKATDVPSLNRRVDLLQVANPSVGGESADKTDVAHPGWLPIAMQAKKAVLNPWHTGLDLIAEDIAKSPAEQRWWFIEMNVNPTLGVHIFPVEGVSRDVGGSLLELTLGGTERVHKAYRMQIIGKVQGVGYRAWFRQVCGMRSVIGWVQNMPQENRVDALVVGTECALRQVFALAEKGPRRAKVKKVKSKQLATVPKEVTQGKGMTIH